MEITSRTLQLLFSMIKKELNFDCTFQKFQLHEKDCTVILQGAKPDDTFVPMALSGVNAQVINGYHLIKDEFFAFLKTYQNRFEMNCSVTNSGRTLPIWVKKLLHLSLILIYTVYKHCEIYSSDSDLDT